jgi:hypothetical protein
MKKAGKIAIGGLALLTLAGSACAPKRQFADNHLYGDKINFSKTTNKDVPYQKERETMFHENYYFKEADNSYENALDFELAPEDLAYDRITPKTGKVKIDYIEEFVPIKQKNLDRTWATQIEIVDYKAAIENIPIKNKFQKTIITENGKKYSLPAVKVKNQEYLILKAFKEKPGTLRLYFIPFTEDLDILIDSKGKITLENKIDGIYRPILDQKNTKENSSKNTTGKIVEESNEMYHTIQDGDTFWYLGEIYYGTGKESTTIQKLNPNIKPTDLKVGQKIRVK